MQSVLLKAAGLYTFPNSLSEIPPGSLLTADNVIIDRNGIIEPRRGFQQYGNTFGIGTDRAKQLMTYKNRILRHFGTTIQYDSDGVGTFLSFNGTYEEVEAGLRIKYIEANGNLYFTTAAGIECISALNASQFSTAPAYIRPAGAAQALDLNGVVDYSGGGWFTYQTSQPGQTKVAYRVTWGFYDANGNFVEGAPSSRLVLTNFSTTDSANVDLTFTIPSQIVSASQGYFYRVYRTAIVQTSIGVTLINLDPGDEENLVIQDFPTSGQLISRVVTVLDNVPDSFRRNGALLYTNPVSGEGILQSNYPPPIAHDINLFQNTVFYANTQTVQQLNLSLLSVENMISGTSTITVGGITYTFVGTPEVQELVFNTQSATTDGGYFLINSSSNARRYFVWYNKSGSPEIQDLTFSSQATTNDGGYFLINSANDVDQYFVWFDKTGTTPIPTGADTIGRIGIRVDIQSVTTASQVAIAVANAASGSTDFSISTTGAPTIRITNLSSGITTPVSDGFSPVGGFTHTVFQAGTNPTAQPTGSDTIGRLPIPVDISQSVSAADVTAATMVSITGTDFNAGQLYTFTVSPANATIGAVYSNNTQSFKVISTISGGTTLSMSGSGAPTSSGTLTLSSGVGDPSITFPSVTSSLNTMVVFNTDNGVTTAAVDSAIVPTPLVSASVIHAGTGATTSTTIFLGGSISASQNIDETARSIVTAINSNPASTVVAFYQSGPTDLPGMILLQSKVLSNPSFPIIADTTVTGAEFSPAIPTSGTTVSSSNLGELNAIYYSKFQQPEAVPIVNKFLVGPKDRAILRILPLRTGLMIIKEDGIYRLTGVNGQFNIDPFDNSAICLAPDSAAVLNNQIYMFSTQGVVTLTDTGVSVISRPIEDQLDKIVTPSYDFKPNTFGVSYESDRAYLLWTVTNTNDTQPTQCFRYNTFTNAWTRWPITKTCGVILFTSQVLYLGPGDENFIEIERKNIDRTDYADRIYPIQIPANSVISSDEVLLSSIANVLPGDVLVQTQYLTIYQYNQLLKMLDTDPGVSFTNYFSSLGALPGVNLRSALDNLALKMDTDPGLAESNFYSSMTHGSNFVDFQTDFNILTSLLNANPNANFGNYVTSIGTIVFEMLVDSLNQNSTVVNVQYIVPIIQGGILSYRGIKSEVTWAPQTFGDPSISKHVSEGTFMFDNTSFFSATISYASDLMPGFESVPFPELGIGDWGDFVWDDQTWGGGGTSVPLRTYIPRNKQYCRFLLPRFSHVNAREKFSLIGGSLTFRPLTERAYRS